ncbi:hypothetical protein N7456_001527 [Penicillium angulare]|uniref:Uncharacterized protein n=1 Tax=Penicillium angulare TaxID=116970 RepID=A0A9W9KPF5_9EURO|nr:hypothetical protein N7456_001527 [Penicillium angulare]
MWKESTVFFRSLSRPNIERREMWREGEAKVAESRVLELEKVTARNFERLGMRDVVAENSFYRLPN